MFALRRLVEALVTEQVSFVVIGGVALTVQGSARATYDLDLCYGRDRPNLHRLARALAPLRPRLRDFPPELPFLWDEQTLRSGLNFTMRCEAGDIDLLGEVPGLGSFPEVLAASEEVDLYGYPVRILTLDGLERTKRAAGRAKDLLDLETIASLRIAREES
jgi:predicted nucleotidyltransferase